MKLDLSKMREITVGALFVREVDGVFRFARFTQEQIDAWDRTGFVPGARTSTGVFLSFVTNSEYVSFVPSTSGKYELRVDDKLVVASANCMEEKKVYLDGKEHEIMLALPSHGGAGNNGFIRVSLMDGASVIPTEKRLKWLFIGDSITQGWGTENDTNSYSYRLTRHYKADAINFGVGGSVFDADVFDDGIDFEPDIVTVAYGTNDWARGYDKERYAQNCEKMLAKIAKRYKTAKKYCITPVWRDNENDIGRAGTLNDCRELISAIAKRYDFKIIDGKKLIPNSLEYFVDGLHPNDEGYEFYAKNLIAEFDV